MLEFTCPFCGKRVQGDDSAAGQMLKCPGCQGTFPARPAASTAIAEGGLPPRARTQDGAFSEGLPPGGEIASLRKRASVIPTLVTILLVLAIIATALLVPATEKVREAAARTHTVNNLKQIGLAAQSFHDAHKRLPTNGVSVAVDGPLIEIPAAAAANSQSGSWAFKLIPYIESAPIFLPTDLNRSVPVYMCAGRGRPAVCTTGAWTDFMINPFINDPDGNVNAPDRRRTLLGVQNGASNVVFAGHGMISPNLYASNVAHAQSTDIFKGGNPALARQSTKNQRDTNDDAGLTWGSPFPQGAAMVMCDGTVRFIPYTISGGVIRNGVADGGLAMFLTPAGREGPAQLPD